MKFKGTKKYVSTEDLSMAVNASVTLERPLLIKGEPGTGKTLLAIEVAESLGKRLIESNSRREGEILKIEINDSIKVENKKGEIIPLKFANSIEDLAKSNKLNDKYFNVLNNYWKLDKLPQKIKKAQGLCRQIPL